MRGARAQLLCRRGLVLRAASRYRAPEAGGDGLGTLAFDPRAHLTNTAVNSVEPLPLEALWEQLSAAGARPRAVWRRIKALVPKLLCTYHVSGPTYSRENCGACFDLFGVDILLDRFFQPVSVATHAAAIRAIVQRILKRTCRFRSG